MSPGPLEGRAAVVTGAARGIGRAIAEALAVAGAAVVLNAFTAEDEEQAARAAEGIRSAGGRAVVAVADTAARKQVAGLVQRCAQEFGRLDIFVNNAGIMLLKPALELTEEEWRRSLAVDLDGYFFGCQAAARRMLAEGHGGKIINVASINHRLGLKYLAPYDAAKGGVVAMSRTLAVEWAEHGINVNVLSPGAVETPLNRDAYTAKVRRNYAQRIPQGVIAAPRDIAGAAVFLASPAADYVTGAELVVDGGFSVNGTVGHGER
ncbi:MAG: glucose 1-dehydrogenase [Thermaerobacter sp.]|nr:glucose 1-dehydrogenase [Thermaerobacter sp.]